MSKRGRNCSLTLAVQSSQPLWERSPWDHPPGRLRYRVIPPHLASLQRALLLLPLLVVEAHDLCPHRRLRFLRELLTSRSSPLPAQELAHSPPLDWGELPLSVDRRGTQHHRLQKEPRLSMKKNARPRAREVERHRPLSEEEEEERFRLPREALVLTSRLPVMPAAAPEAQCLGRGRRLPCPGRVGFGRHRRHWGTTCAELTCSFCHHWPQAVGESNLRGALWWKPALAAAGSVLQGLLLLHQTALEHSLLGQSLLGAARLCCCTQAHE